MPPPRFHFVALIKSIDFRSNFLIVYTPETLHLCCSTNALLLSNQEDSLETILLLALVHSCF